jgi:hypothetical protein
MELCELLFEKQTESDVSLLGIDLLLHTQILCDEESRLSLQC